VNPDLTVVISGVDDAGGPMWTVRGVIRPRLYPMWRGGGMGWSGSTRDSA